MTDVQTQIKRALDRAAEQLSKDVAEIFRSAFGGQPATPSSEAPAEGRKRFSHEDVESVLVGVVDALKKAPDGLRLEGLKAATGQGKPELVRAIKVGLESDQLAKRGDRRTTTYFLPSHAAQEGRVVKRKKKA